MVKPDPASCEVIPLHPTQSRFLLLFVLFDWQYSVNILCIELCIANGNSLSAKHVNITSFVAFAILQRNIEYSSCETIIGMDS